MSHTIVGKLNKDARQFQAGESTGFGVRLGVKFRDPKTKQDEWTNYQAVIFAKSLGQIQFYQNVLVAGSIIEVSAEQLKIDQFNGDNGTVLSIDMLNARLGFVHSTNDVQQQQGGYNSQPQQVPQQQHQVPQQQGGYHSQPQQGYNQPQQGGYNQGRG